MSGQKQNNSSNSEFVRIRKPQIQSASLVWVESMDEFDGLLLPRNAFSTFGKFLVYERWHFLPEWLEPADPVESQLEMDLAEIDKKYDRIVEDIYKRQQQKQQKIKPILQKKGLFSRIFGR